MALSLDIISSTRASQLPTLSSDSRLPWELSAAAVRLKSWFGSCWRAVQGLGSYRTSPAEMGHSSGPGQNPEPHKEAKQTPHTQMQMWVGSSEYTEEDSKAGWAPVTQKNEYELCTGTSQSRGDGLCLPFSLCDLQFPRAALSVPHFPPWPCSHSSVCAPFQKLSFPSSLEPLILQIDASEKGCSSQLRAPRAAGQEPQRLQHLLCTHVNMYVTPSRKNNLHFTVSRPISFFLTQVFP